MEVTTQTIAECPGRLETKELFTLQDFYMDSSFS